MSHSSKSSLLGLLILASSASAMTVGPARGKPVTGRPLEVNIPFAVDEPAERACASANVRYGDVLVPRTVLHVEGHGLKRNLLVTSRTNVSEPTVTVNVRVGCGAKSVARRFVLQASVPTAKATLASKPVPKPVALMTPAEPLFPPPEASPPEPDTPKADASTTEELRKARADAATAVAQLETTRRELAAVLDVERRTSQTLINADHEVRDAKSEAASMRLVLKWVGAALALAAAGVIWLEVKRLAPWERMRRAQPAQEPTILTGAEVPT
jgi:hypothetical protein